MEDSVWSSQALAWLGLWAYWGYAPKSFSQARTCFVSAWEAPGAGMSVLLGLGLGEAAARRVVALRGLDLEALGRAQWGALPQNAWVLPREDPRVGALWEAMRWPPPFLYGWGDVQLLKCCPEQAVAVVGSRQVDQAGRRQTEEVARELVQQGRAVVSGGALGVDAAAHHSALRAGGVTVAVLGVGLDRLYPASNRGLFMQMVESGRGVVLSPFAPGGGGRRYHFPRRNALIAAMTQATVVTRARLRSGSLLTAQAAMRYGRPVGVFPADISLPEGRGSNSLLQTGAQPLLEPSLVSTLWSGAQTTAPPEVQGALWEAPPPRQGLAGELLEQLRSGPLGIDELVRGTGEAAGRVQNELMELELEGHIQRSAGGIYRRCV